MSKDDQFIEFISELGQEVQAAIKSIESEPEPEQCYAMVSFDSKYVTDTVQELQVVQVIRNYCLDRGYVIQAGRSDDGDMIQIKIHPPIHHEVLH